MPAQSKAQRRFFALALQYKKENLSPLMFQMRLKSCQNCQLKH